MNWSRPALVGRRAGGPVLNPDSRLHDCAVCYVQTEMTFMADSNTHAILNRSGDTAERALCVKCWSRLLKNDDED